ncbi:unnamed protein product [Prunus armeniaca]
MSPRPTRIATRIEVISPRPARIATWIEVVSPRPTRIAARVDLVSLRPARMELTDHEWGYMIDTSIWKNYMWLDPSVRGQFGHLCLAPTRCRARTGFDSDSKVEFGSGLVRTSMLLLDNVEPLHYASYCPM